MVVHIKEGSSGFLPKPAAQTSTRDGQIGFHLRAPSHEALVRSVERDEDRSVELSGPRLLGALRGWRHQPAQRELLNGRNAEQATNPPYWIYVEPNWARLHHAGSAQQTAKCGWRCG